MTKTKKGPFWAKVCGHKQTGKTFYKLSLELSGEGAKAFSQTRPGQFVEIDLSTIALPPIEAIPEEFAQRSKRGILLRRPFSFCDVITKKDKTIAEILYGVVGPASLRMTTLKNGDRVNIIGPLGNGFSIPKGKRAVLLVSGGMGCPPLLHLLNFIARDYPAIKVTVFAGAKSKEDLPCSELAKGNLGRGKKGKKPPEQFVTKQGQTKSYRILVMETFIGNYPREVVFEYNESNMSQLNQIIEGKWATITFNLDGRKSIKDGKARWYNKLNGLTAIKG